MYLRKALEEQRPMSIMVKVGTLSRYITMAAPERIECVPVALGWKPRRSLPTFSAAERIFLWTVEELMVFSFLPRNIVLTLVSAFIPG